LEPLREDLLAQLLSRQYRRIHPYTHSPAGGWAWTDLSGGVPDGDDTAGALKALHRLSPADSRAREAAQAGVGWLLQLQNRDGGVPTFCRGWGKLPFDASCPDITAHACRAWALWQPHMPERLARKLEAAQGRAWRYLRRAQREDGAWVPLWFGNQFTSRQENPVFGTAQVVRAFAAGEPPELSAALSRGRDFLLEAQGAEGAWGGDIGGPVSIEETALATSALLGHETAREAARRGLEWLAAQVARHPVLPAAPIGLYFASLWYDEELYPYVFAMDALNRAKEVADGA
jgi:squalene-hopene/tetraprenyl-beta-curcumene cyclase